MPRLAEIFKKLQRECPVGEDGQPVGITYTAITEAFRAYHVLEEDILQNLREIVLAELAAGVSAYQGMCGPEIHGATFRTSEGRQLVSLLNGILDVQGKLDELRKVNSCPATRSEESLPGSTSPDTEASPST